MKRTGHRFRCCSGIRLIKHMKRLAHIALMLLGLLLGSFGVAQDNFETIMQRGLDLHNQGKYELSLIEYNKALKMAPKSAWVNYEMAMSYYYMGKKEKALGHAKTGVKEKSENGVQCVVLLGTIYDELGKSKKSIKAYKKGVKDYGDYYLIWFNLGVSANGMGDLELAEKAFLKSASNKRDHASSHYALAAVKMQQGKKAEAMLPIYFFLLLEPDTDRSQRAYADLRDLWAQGVEKTDSNQISLTLAPMDGKKEDPSRMADFMVTLIEASSTLKENASKTEFEQYRDKTKKYFDFLTGLDFEGRQDLLTTYYIPFFGRLAKSEHMDAFTHFIRQSSSRESQDWIQSHADDLEALFVWLDEKE